MTATTAQCAQCVHRIHDLEAIHVTDTAQIRFLQGIIATRDAQIVALNLLNQVVADRNAHIAVLTDFIEAQDETHADEMALLNHLNEAVNERLNREIAARHERTAQRDGQANGMPSNDGKSELMSRVRLIVAAQAYEILAGYGVHYRELAQKVDDCIEALKAHQPRDAKEPILNAMQAIKSACHTLADNIVVCREGGIHENFRSLWPGSLESVETPTADMPKSRGISARRKAEE